MGWGDSRVSIGGLGRRRLGGEAGLPRKHRIVHVQQAGELQDGALVHGVLKGTNLFCYWRAEDADTGQEPRFTIAINKVMSPTALRPT